MTELQLVGHVLMAIGVAVIISFLATPLVKALAYKVGAIDVPKDGRRMHKVPIPRLGGLAIFLAFLLSTLLFAEIDRQMQGILMGAVIIVILGVMDDIMTLKALPKFFVQILAASIAVYHGCVIQFISNFNLFSDTLYLDLGWLSVPVTIIWIVAITNAVNFIDGLDGLAVGVSAISAGTMLVIALMVAEGNLAIVIAALLGACIGFIPYNFNPAKIFMGDTGSTFLGYILATLSIQGLFKMYAIISFAVPFLILGVPIFDICFAFLRRIAKGQNPMVADRGHVHHRLIDMGFSQKQSVAITYMLTAILGLAAVVLTTSGEFKAMFLIGSVFIVGAIGMRLIFADRQEPAEDAAVLDEMETAEKSEEDQQPAEEREPSETKEDDTHEQN
jgi:UDP-GlcNAc:undecaprenyl-phosphate GlcNAc-1-phosphate transferase